MLNFSESGLDPQILKAIEELGFETPTPIQSKAIPTILNSGQDMIALAQTGTGKTAAFGLPVVQMVDYSKPVVQGIILCPTRELCLQITADLKRFSKYLPKLEVVPVYGGTDIRAQIKSLRDGAQIVVGTPGRVNDLGSRGILKLNDVKWLVLDEADEMLNMGFKEELDAIIGLTPKERQTLLFSATMAGPIADMADRYMVDPIEIRVGNKNESTTNVTHEYYMVHAKDRYAALKRIADITPNIYGIVFCRTRQETKDIADHLISDGYNADALHGDLSQAQRDQVMARFRTKHLQILVATDVAARGIDINELTHVINYNLPDDIEVYIHRSGRTGRAGRLGTSIAIIHTKEFGRIRQIEKISARKFERKLVPTGVEICEKQLFHIIEKVQNIDIENTQIDSFLPAILDKFKDISQEELVKRFVSIEFSSILDYYKNAQDLNVYNVHKEAFESRDGRSDRRERSDRPDRRGDRPERGERPERGDRGGNFSRLFINFGDTKNLSAPRLIGMINEHTKQRNIEIGKIEILRNFSFFEVDKAYENDVVRALNMAEFDGEKISVEVASAKPSGEGDRSRSRGRSEGGRSEGGYRGASDRPRSEGASGGYRGASDRPRSESRSEGGYRGSSDRPRTEGGRSEGGYRGGSDRPRTEGSSDRPRTEGGSTGGFRGGDRPRTEGGSAVVTNVKNVASTEKMLQKREDTN